MAPSAPPVAVDDSGTTPYETPLVVAAPGVLDNDTGTRPTVTSNTDPTFGTVVVAPDGSFTYTPDAGFAGLDAFTYTITDAAGQTDTATVTITVDMPPAPLAADDAGSTPFETPLTVVAPGLLGNDSGTGITVTSNSTPANGTVTVAPDGSLVYTPDTGFTGTVTFTYEISDS